MSEVLLEPGTRVFVHHDVLATNYLSWEDNEGTIIFIVDDLYFVRMSGMFVERLTERWRFNVPLKLQVDQFTAVEVL